MQMALKCFAVASPQAVKCSDAGVVAVAAAAVSQSVQLLLSEVVDADAAAVHSGGSLARTKNTAP
jgi:hypothetical protein